MPLPINITEVLHGKTVEWERLEFKKGWNPEAGMHTLCAFANDFHNLGGGYIFIGIGERSGRPVLPPAGLKTKDIDRIQKEIVELGHRIQPYYHPVVAPYEIEGRHVLVLWAPGGQTRPYKAPVSCAKGCREYAYYIRKTSTTVKAKQQDERELIGLAATVPFDDRMNHHAKVEDLDLSLAREFLREAGSDLYADAGTIKFEQLCRQMNIVDGPDEMLRPRNVGLMFFNEKPDRFFPQAQIDVVQFPEGPGGDVFKEKIFKGPLNRMVKEALDYINSTLIEEIVVKHPRRAEAERFFNYPFAAIEEALVNAIYHRSYEIREPVEVRILPDCLTIGSFPGPDRSISKKDLMARRFLSRRYRNRRIGEFLKELDLTEGRGTGIPKMLKAIKKNGSPIPKFETDDDRTYFLTVFPIHPKAKKKTGKGALEGAGPTPEVGDQVGTKLGLSQDQVEVLRLCRREQPLTAMMKAVGRQNRTKFRDGLVKPLIEAGFLELTIPDKPNSRFQKYRLTDKGRRRLGG